MRFQKIILLSRDVGQLTAFGIYPKPHDSPAPYQVPFVAQLCASGRVKWEVWMNVNPCCVISTAAPATVAVFDCEPDTCLDMLQRWSGGLHRNGCAVSQATSWALPALIPSLNRHFLGN